MTQSVNEKIAKLNENKNKVAEKIPEIRKKFIENKENKTDLKLKNKVK